MSCMHISIVAHLTPETSVRTNVEEHVATVHFGPVSPGGYPDIKLFISPDDYRRVATQLRDAADQLDAVILIDEATP